MIIRTSEQITSTFLRLNKNNNGVVIGDKNWICLESLKKYLELRDGAEAYQDDFTRGCLITIKELIEDIDIELQDKRERT